MTAKQDLNTELEGRTVSGVAKALEKTVGEDDASHFGVRTYIYSIVRVKERPVEMRERNVKL